MFIQPFRNFCACLLVTALLSPVLAQQPQTRPASRSKPKAAPTAKRPSPDRATTAATPRPSAAAVKSQFETAIDETDPSVKAELLVKFIADHPKSEFKVRAEESLAGARAAIADSRLTAGDAEGAVRLFKLAINDAPKPYSERLFANVIATIPANLYWRGFKAEGVELAQLVEKNIASEQNRLLVLLNFYLSSENGEEARRLAEAALKLDEKNPSAHQALAVSHRLNFDLESAAASFARALELDARSAVSVKSLADLKRALGTADEAEKLYREILSADEKDVQAQTGLVMSLFDLGKRAEAEELMSRSLEETPGNVVLLASAAYWYAANKEGDRAVEYARRALEKDPRYVWSHIALGRGLMLQGKPVEAEQALVAARKFGNFPTLQYEIASARFAAGFFREAAEELSKSFSLADGSISTRLGGRIEKTGRSFLEALDLERRASIFVPTTADPADDAARLKALFELIEHTRKDIKDFSAIVAAADRFADGRDNMSPHRKLYAANVLLQNNIAAEDAARIAASAVAELETSLDVPNAGAAVMASELYEARTTAFSRDDFLLIPDVPRQTLLSLMRGRLEETAGLALLRQGKPGEAGVRFRRALTVLPKDSAWWRSATWNLGSALAAEGKDQEALDTMISSYSIDKPNPTRYILIEQLWIRTKGNRDGLEDRIGPNPLPNFAVASPVPLPSPSVPVSEGASAADKLTSTTAEKALSPTPQPEVPPATDVISASRTPVATPSPATTPDEVKTSEADIPPTPDAKPSPSVEPSVPAETSESKLTPSPSPEPSISPTPVQDLIPESPPRSDAQVVAQAVSEQPSPSARAASVGDAENASKETRRNSSVDEARRPGPPSQRGSPLFEPIIITIPRPATDRQQSKMGEQASDEKKPGDDSADISAPPTHLQRPRVVEGKAIVGELLPCEISVSQESVSLINNGGSMSMLVTIEDGEDIEMVAGESKNPLDIEVRRQSDTPSVRGRAMFVIRSLSEKTGLFQVSFKAPCGKKDVIVRVR